MALSLVTLLRYIIASLLRNLIGMGTSVAEFGGSLGFTAPRVPVPAFLRNLGTKGKDWAFAVPEISNFKMALYSFIPYFFGNPEETVEAIEQLFTDPVQFLKDKFGHYIEMFKENPVQTLFLIAFVFASAVWFKMKSPEKVAKWTKTPATEPATRQFFDEFFNAVFATFLTWRNGEMASLSLDRTDLENHLSHSGVSPEKRAELEQQYEEVVTELDYVMGDYLLFCFFSKASEVIEANSSMPAGLGEAACTIDDVVPALNEAIDAWLMEDPSISSETP